MPLFMAQFAYTPGAWAAFLRTPQDRAAAIEIAAVAAGHLSRNRLTRILSDEEMKSVLKMVATAPPLALS